MPVIFPGSSTIDVGTARSYLNQSTGDVRYLMSITGNSPADAFSDWRNVDFYGDMYLEQGDGYIWDGCSGRDHWGWYECTDEYGSYVGPYGGPSTYNSERGYNNGTFLTFGYGYSRTRLRPYTGVYVVSQSSGTNCGSGFTARVWEFGYKGNRASDTYTATYSFTIGFQEGRSFIVRLTIP